MGYIYVVNGSIGMYSKITELYVGYRRTGINCCTTLLFHACIYCSKDKLKDTVLGV